MCIVRIVCSKNIIINTYLFLFRRRNANKHAIINKQYFINYLIRNIIKLQRKIIIFYYLKYYITKKEYQ